MKWIRHNWLQELEELSSLRYHHFQGRSSLGLLQQVNALDVSASRGLGKIRVRTHVNVPDLTLHSGTKLVMNRDLSGMAHLIISTA